MPKKVAEAAPNTVINIGEHVFDFGSDGKRQVTEAEAALLENGYTGSLTIQIKESKGGK